MVEYLIEKVEKEFKTKEKAFGEKLWMDVVRAIFLSTIDKYWTEHLTGIEDLREGINLRGYAQLDPLVEYKNEAYSMFERLNADINFEATRRLFKIELQTSHSPSVQNEPKQPMVFKSASSVDPFSQAQQQTLSQTGMNQPQPVKQIPANDQPTNNQQTGFRIIPPGQTHKKIGRNDPCPCGSGKKWKKCHYPNIP